MAEQLYTVGWVLLGLAVLVWVLRVERITWQWGNRERTITIRRKRKEADGG